jgi:hypothetical protein
VGAGCPAVEVASPLVAPGTPVDAAVVLLGTASAMAVSPSPSLPPHATAPNSNTSPLTNAFEFLMRITNFRTRLHRARRQFDK